ncbi:MAG TPA: hypothetical protein VJS90_09940 [Pseudomonas sp.]|nr:hypothetical protein [Pseudomonas sp.]HKS13342.1 hypothetical protein [Pseudomonas sp.]
MAAVEQRQALAVQPVDAVLVTAGLPTGIDVSGAMAGWPTLATLT